MRDRFSPPAVLILIGLIMAAPAAMASATGNLNGLDANHDGVVSRQEAIAAQKRAFQHLDKNEDGQISWREFDDSRPDGTPDHELSLLEKQRRTHVRRGWFENLDRNDNGQISLSEYEAGMMPYFNRLDSNGDGAIDRQEMKKAFQGETGSKRQP